MGCDVEALDGGRELGMDYMGVEWDGKELGMGGKELEMDGKKLEMGGKEEI